MSLVGSEVDVSRSGASSPEVSDYDMHRESYEDLHPAMSPMCGAEHLFLSGLETQNISAAALAQQLHRRHRSGGSGTVGTDDFMTAIGDSDHNDAFVSSLDYLQHEQQPPPSIFENDAITLTRDPHEVHQINNKTFQDSDMMKTSTPSNSTPSAPKKVDVKPAVVPNEFRRVDPAEKVYDTAKNVWGWTKGFIVFRPFMGLAEIVANKAVGVVGCSLASIDGATKDKLSGLDEHLLNPAIVAVVALVLNVVKQTDARLRPMLLSVLKPFGLIKNVAENPEMTTPEGVSSSKD